MEACLPKVVDRGPLLLTLGAAGATLLVMLAVVGIPAIDACRADPRGLGGCLRGIVNDKFGLGDAPQPDPPLTAAPADLPAVADAPARPAMPGPDVQVAATPAAQPTPEPTRSLAPLVADKSMSRPLAPPPQVAATPPVPAEPEIAEAPVEAAEVEQADAAPAPTIALAEVVEPEAPSFVPPAPAIAVDGIPPDLQVAAVSPDPAAPAPDFALPQAPELPTTPPPDLVAVARIVVSDSPDAPELHEPVAPVATIDPAAEAAPSFVLPSTPELPATPPPDLTIAAVDPAAPVEPPSGSTLPPTPLAEPAVAAVDSLVPFDPAPAAPVLTPTIDAVEIDGDGSFIAGNGPAGATMRLYVDGIPVGVSPVDGGRWLVEGTNLLTEPSQTLKVEALDAITGKLLGDATIVFERPAEPVAGAPTPDDLSSMPVDERPAPLTLADPEATNDQPSATTEPAEAAPELPSVADQPEVVSPVSEQPEEAPAPAPAIPQIAPVVPAGETPSVTILKPGSPPDITTLTSGAPSESSVVNLSALPKQPAIVAHFTFATTKVAEDVTVLRAVPFGDPGAGRFVSGKAIIRRGDTLWDIAHRYYGLGIRYRTIFRANRDLIARPGKIFPGQVFDLPLVYDD